MIRLPADELVGASFDIESAGEAQLRYALGLCSLRRDLWDGVCVELEEALEKRNDADEERRRKAERKESGWSDEGDWIGDDGRHPEDGFE